MSPPAVPPGAQSLSDRWFQLRNRLLSSARFQRWAAWFPFTRRVARRRAAALFDLCAGFVYSQVLQAAVRLGLFDALRAGPRTVAELAPALALHPAAASRLLAAAAALKLVERRRGERYGLGIHGAALLGNPAVAALVEHHALLYRDLQDPVALLRGELPETELGRFWSYTGSPHAHSTSAQVAPYSSLMTRSLGLIAEDILDAYPIGRHRCLLDVGGGEGAFVEAAARRAPGLALVLFDLPAVAARARARLERAGMGARVRVVGGDAIHDRLPEGADLITLLRVLHDHDDEAVLRVLIAARRALRPGGTLLIAEPMAGTAGAEPMGDSYFGFYLLAMGQGRPRTPAQLQDLLRAAGFGPIRAPHTRRPLLTSLLVVQPD